MYFNCSFSQGTQMMRATVPYKNHWSLHSSYRLSTVLLNFYLHNVSAWKNIKKMFFRWFCLGPQEGRTCQLWKVFWLKKYTSCVNNSCAYQRMQLELFIVTVLSAYDVWKYKFETIFFLISGVTRRTIHHTCSIVSGVTIRRTLHHTLTWIELEGNIA